MVMLLRCGLIIGLDHLHALRLMLILGPIGQILLLLTYLILTRMAGIKSELQVFHHMDSDRILVQQINYTGNEDTRAWCLDRQGRFSVKSTYQFAYLLHNVMGTTSTSQPSQLLCIWKFLRKAKFPSRLRIWLWRAIHNKLPTCDQLRKRESIIQNNCVLCNNHTKDLQHLLFKCEISRKLCPQRFPHLDFFPHGLDIVDAWISAWHMFSKSNFIYFALFG